MSEQPTETPRTDAFWEPIQSAGLTWNNACIQTLDFARQLELELSAARRSNAELEQRVSEMAAEINRLSDDAKKNDTFLETLIKSRSEIEMKRDSYAAECVTLAASNAELVAFVKETEKCKCRMMDKARQLISTIKTP